MLYYLLLIPAVLSTAWIYFLSPALSYWWLLPILIGCFAAANLVYVLLMFVCSWFAGPNKMYTHISPFYHALTMALDGWILALTPYPLCRIHGQRPDARAEYNCRSVLPQRTGLFLPLRG